MKWNWLVKIYTEKDTTAESTQARFPSVPLASKNSEREPPCKSSYRVVSEAEGLGFSPPWAVPPLPTPSWPKLTRIANIFGPHNLEMESRKWLKNGDFCLKHHWYNPAEFSVRGTFVPWETSGNIWRHFQLSRRGKGCYWQGPRMLLNIHPTVYRTVPPTKNYRAQTSAVLGMRPPTQPNHARAPGPCLQVGVLLYNEN